MIPCGAAVSIVVLALALSGCSAGISSTVDLSGIEIKASLNFASPGGRDDAAEAASPGAPARPSAPVALYDLKPRTLAQPAVQPPPGPGRVALVVEKTAALLDHACASYRSAAGRMAARVGSWFSRRVKSLRGYGDAFCDDVAAHQSGDPVADAQWLGQIAGGLLATAAAPR